MAPDLGETWKLLEPALGGICPRQPPAQRRLWPGSFTPILASMTLPPTPRQGLDTYLYLKGFPSLDEFISYVQHNAPHQQLLDTRALAGEWREANTYLKSLETLEVDSGKGASERFAPLPPEYTELAEQVMNDPVVKHGFDIVPFDIQLVALDSVSVFQKHLNLTYVQSLQERLSPQPSFDEVFRFCLLDPPQPEVKMARVAANGYVLVSPSNDLRFLGPVLLEPQQVTGYQLPGRAAGVIGLVAGPGSNCLSVTAYQGRVILNNGTHRAAALYRQGVTHVPVIVQHASYAEELEALFSSKVMERLSTFLELGHPPLFKDYFNTLLTKSLSVPRKLTQIKVTFGWESIEVPIV